MKQRLVFGIIVLVVIFAAIQAVPVRRDNPRVQSDFDGPADVKGIFRKACYDCHSNETRWPWYSRIAPVSWLVTHDISEGRDELNFSEWDRYTRDKDIREEIHEEIAEGTMPLWLYRLAHPEARLTEADTALVRLWAGEGDRDRKDRRRRNRD